MNEETILTWNFTNWLTVLIMVTVGFAVLRLLTTLIAKQGA